MTKKKDLSQLKNADKPYCKSGVLPRGRKYGNMLDCARLGEINRYGLLKADSKTIQLVKKLESEKKQKDKIKIKIASLTGKIKNLVKELQRNISDKKRKELQKDLDDVNEEQRMLIKELRSVDKKNIKPVEVKKLEVLKEKIEDNEDNLKELKKEEKKKNKKEKQEIKQDIKELQKENQKLEEEFTEKFLAMKDYDFAGKDKKKKEEPKKKKDKSKKKKQYKYLNEDVSGYSNKQADKDYEEFDNILQEIALRNDDKEEEKKYTFLSQAKEAYDDVIKSNDFFKKHKDLSKVDPEKADMLKMNFLSSKEFFNNYKSDNGKWDIALIKDELEDMYVDEDDEEEDE
jgi:DNA repair exonuclease SbcCD ATPase subunit